MNARPRMLAAAIPLIVLTACADTQVLQDQIDDLKLQLTRVQADLKVARHDAATASQALTTANQALKLAQGSQTCCEATNEKIDQMFRPRLDK